VERQLVTARSAALKTDGSMPATSTAPRPASCRTAGLHLPHLHQVDP